MSAFRPGDHIILREIWRRRVWCVRPAVLVRDADDLIAVYNPAGTTALFPRTAHGEILRIPTDHWVLRPVELPEHHVLGLHVPGERHSVLLIWDSQWRFVCWYINLEEALRRMRLGFDYKDRILDVIVEPDMKTWRWKDEDELTEAVVAGVFTEADTADFHAEGESALKRLLGREPPFDRPWEDWRPPGEWTTPALPNGWEIIE